MPLFYAPILAGGTHLSVCAAQSDEGAEAMGKGGWVASTVVRNERAAGRERQAAQSAFAWGERGDAQ